jgi:hypothetical protein
MKDIVAELLGKQSPKVQMVLITVFMTLVVMAALAASIFAMKFPDREIAVGFGLVHITAQLDPSVEKCKIAAKVKDRDTASMDSQITELIKIEAGYTSSISELRAKFSAADIHGSSDFGIHAGQKHSSYLEDAQRDYEASISARKEAQGRQSVLFEEHRTADKICDLPERVDPTTSIPVK